jgi:acetyl esterase/lipase
MAFPTSDAAATRFESFDIYTTSYKTIGDHGIAANVLIPKNLKSGQSPLFVKWHGGGLVFGEATYAEWFAAWLVPFILRNNAIVVLPNYRLIPEHNGKDIMEDLADFWQWFDTKLEDFVKTNRPDAKLDFNRLLVGGDSAGGLMALQSAIFEKKEGKFRALLAQYPMTEYLRGSQDAPPVPGMEVPGPDYIDKHIASIKPGTVLSSSLQYDRFPLSVALAIHKRWQEFYGKEKELLPITAVEDATWFPPALIIHGASDAAVDVEDTKAFVKKAGEILGEEVKENIRLEIVAGEDHGFDIGLSEDQADWLRDALKWLEGKWLA